MDFRHKTLHDMRYKDAVFFCFNYLLCVVVKIMSLQAHAIGPVLIICGPIFYFAYRQKRPGVVLYVLLSVVAVGALLYGAGMLYLIFFGYDGYKAFQSLCFAYIILGVTHIFGVLLILRSTKKHKNP